MHLAQDTVELYVMLPNGVRTITLVANLSDTCDSFMLLVKQATGIPCHQQRLITMNDMTLEHGHTLNEYKLKNHSKLTLAPCELSMAFDWTVSTM